MTNQDKKAKKEAMENLAYHLYDLLEENGDAGVVAYGMMPKQILDILEDCLHNLWKEQEKKAFGDSIEVSLTALAESLKDPESKKAVEAEIEELKQYKQKWIADYKKQIHIAIMKEAKRRNRLIV